MTVRYNKVIEAADWSVTPYKKEVRADVEEFQGVTIKIEWRSTQVMSDVWEQERYALVWDEANNKPTQVCWINGGEVDATPEVLEKYRQYLVAVEFEQIMNARKAEAAKIVKDSVVEVVAGRTAKGLVGKVVVIIQKPYQSGYHANIENKLAIAKDDETEEYAAANGKVYTRFKNVEWVWARNCKRLDIPAVDEAEALKYAEDRVSYTMKKRA